MAKSFLDKTGLTRFWGKIKSTYIKSLSVSGKVITYTKGDGTTGTITTQDTNTTYGVVTTSANGLMSSADKTKLNGIATGANKTTIVDNLTSASTTSALSASQGKILNNKIIALKLDMNPVGSIILNTSGANPSTYLGGTWIAWGSGRVPVGINTEDTDFSTAEKTGGEKAHKQTIEEMPSHNHPINDASLVNRNITGNGGAQGNNTVLASNITSGYTGGGKAFNILQPYIVCYMWKRTA